jgi:hypothetical protein
MSQDWQSFFTTLAQVAVTAFSVMFLVVQVRSEVWHGRTLLKAAAVVALSELVVPMLVALVIDTGGHQWRLAAFIGGGLGSAMLILYWVLYCLARSRAVFDWIQARIRVLSLLLYLLIMISPAFGGLPLLAGICIWLLLSGCIEAFWLLGSKDARLRPMAGGVKFRSVMHDLREGLQRLRE